MYIMTSFHKPCNKVIHKLILDFSLTFLLTIPSILPCALSVKSLTLDQPWKHKITLQNLTTMITFPTMGQFTLMVRTHRLSYLSVTYPTHLVTYGLYNYLGVLIRNLPIYPKAMYSSPTYLSMGHLGTT